MGAFALTGYPFAADHEWQKLCCAGARKPRFGSLGDARRSRNPVVGGCNHTRRYPGLGLGLEAVAVA